MRKSAHEGLHKSAAVRYHKTQMLEATLLATATLKSPGNWIAHCRRASASAMMAVVYDAPTVTTHDDPSVLAINDMMDRLSNAGLPGAHFVEFLPWMKHIPAR